MSAATDDASARSAPPVLTTPLELVAQMAGEFAATLDVDAALRSAIARIVRHLDAEGGAIFLLDESGTTLVCHACIGPIRLTGSRLDASDGIVGRTVRTGRCQSAAEDEARDTLQGYLQGCTGATTSDGIVADAPETSVRSVLCAPLSVQESCLGVIQLINKHGHGGRFDEHDRHVLQAMASSAALALVNARLARDLVQREGDRHELELAAEIQRSLLPGPLPPSLPVAGINRPTDLVSGDFFDVLVLDGGSIGFAVGDVAGKGMPAALLMARTTSLYHLLAKTQPAPGRLLAALDRELRDTLTHGMFVTMVAGRYDPATRRLQLANAGHEPPLLHEESGRFRALPAEAPPLGLGTDSVGGRGFPELELQLGNGTLYVYTDGLTEARTASGERLGQSGLECLLGALATLPLRARLEAIVEHAACKTTLRDDVTVLAIDGGTSRAAAHDGVAAPGNRRLLTLRFPAQPQRLKDVRQAVREAAVGAGCSPACADDVVMAVDEACQNIIRHAYGGDPTGEIVLEIDHVGDRLMLWLRDFAATVDVATIRPRRLEEIRPGGLGVHLIRQVMDESGFVPCPSGNIFRMIKRIG